MICLDTLYESFHALPSHIQSDDHLATIVPAFEYKEQTELNITSFQDYVLEYILPLLWLIEYRYVDVLPKTKDELKSCLEKKQCAPFRVAIHTHVYAESY